MARKLPAHRRPEERQRYAARDGVQAAVSTIFDSWSKIEAFAAGRGYAGGSGGSKGGSGHSDPVGTAAVSDQVDPFSRWIDDLGELRIWVERMAGRALELTAAPAVTMARANEVDKCVLCGIEVAATPVHRVDNHPLCANTCYFTLYRRAQAAGTDMPTQVAAEVAANAVTARLRH